MLHIKQLSAPIDPLQQKILTLDEVLRLHIHYTGWLQKEETGENKMENVDIHKKSETRTNINE